MFASTPIQMTNHRADAMPAAIKATDITTTRIAAACKAIESSETEIPLADLAAAAGLSPHHFHRVFKHMVGVTPKAWRKAMLARRAETALADARKKGRRVTDALYDAGFNSSAEFYESQAARAGMSARARVRGGAGETIRYVVAPCTLGTVLVAATARGVCAIEFGDAGEALRVRLTTRFPHADFTPADTAFKQWVKQILAYLDEPKGALALPLDIRGTAFQTRVWQALRAIPAGERRSYADIAAAIGAPKAVRAVASACAHNDIAVAIPCHRVVKSDGALSGYRWGVARKAELLQREHAANAAGDKKPAKKTDKRQVKSQKGLA